MAEQKSAGEDLAMRRRRLCYRSWHRGTKEMDLVLGPFADAHVEGWNAEGLSRFEALVEEEDTDLLAWILGQVVPPARIERELLAQLVRFRLEQSRP